MGKLTGADYMTRSYLELQGHPDFSPNAFRIVASICKMSSEEIENMNIVTILGRND
jgi:hypothetical protein